MHSQKKVSTTAFLFSLSMLSILSESKTQNKTVLDGESNNQDYTILSSLPKLTEKQLENAFCLTDNQTTLPLNTQKIAREFYKMITDLPELATLQLPFIYMPNFKCTYLFEEKSWKDFAKQHALGTAMGLYRPLEHLAV